MILVRLDEGLRKVRIEFCQKCVRNTVVIVKPNCLVECCVWLAYFIYNILDVKQNCQQIPGSGTGNYGTNE